MSDMHAPVDYALAVVHVKPDTCTRGLLGSPCPACHSYLRDCHEALLYLADLGDGMKDEVLHWLADEQPDILLRAIREARR